MLNKYGWRQPVIRMAQPGVEPLDLEIRCKITAFPGYSCVAMRQFYLLPAIISRISFSER
jgi:hypothetical protein